MCHKGGYLVKKIVKNIDRLQYRVKAPPTQYKFWRTIPFNSCTLLLKLRNPQHCLKLYLLCVRRKILFIRLTFDIIPSYNKLEYQGATRPSFYPLRGGLVGLQPTTVGLRPISNSNSNLESWLIMICYSGLLCQISAL